MATKCINERISDAKISEAKAGIKWRKLQIESNNEKMLRQTPAGIGSLAVKNDTLNEEISVLEKTIKALSKNCFIF